MVHLWVFRSSRENMKRRRSGRLERWFISGFNKVNDLVDRLPLRESTQAGIPFLQCRCLSSTPDMHYTTLPIDSGLENLADNRRSLEWNPNRRDSMQVGQNGAHMFYQVL